MPKTKVNNKVIILVSEDPGKSTFKEVADALGLPGINPLTFIEPESHMLSTIYKEIFTDELANQLMGYLVHKHPVLLVWDIIERVHADKERLVLVNVTLLTSEDIRFLEETLEHVLEYTLENSPQRDASSIYDGSKAYRDQVGL